MEKIEAGRFQLFIDMDNVRVADGGFTTTWTYMEHLPLIADIERFLRFASAVREVTPVVTRLNADNKTVELSVNYFSQSGNLKIALTCSRCSESFNFMTRLQEVMQRGLSL